MIKHITIILFLIQICVFAQDSITVTSANGGEVWYVGQDYYITWTDNLTGSVEIHLYKDGVFHSVVDESDPSDGIKTWSIPLDQETGTEFIIRISSIDNANIFDISDTVFTLAHSIIVESPNGGESWQAGSDQSITWSDNLIGNVRIELWKEDTFHNIIANSTPSNGGYTWNIDAGFQAGMDYKIKIVSVEYESVDDLSDENFEIFAGPITVTSPNGGEIWGAGQMYSITWDDNLIEPVKIELYKNDVLFLEIEDITPSDGHFIWEVPYDQEGGSDYSIKITSIQFTTKFDFSDDYFTIVANQITVTSPTSGDNWQAGTTHYITWDSNFSNNVSINLFKGGSFYRLISSSTQSDGSFQWTISYDEIGGSDYQIRIGSIINSAVRDLSDFFTITANQITITSPNGGESWYKDSTQTITWIDNVEGDLKIELFEEDNLDDQTPILIVNQTPSNGTYTWNVHHEIEPFTEYRVKITMLADEDVFDFSDTNFSFIGELQVVSPNGGEFWHRA
jgi:hypothetical protein